MKFFIDTANLDQIREAQDLGVLDGVTTNPSLMAKEGITGHENIINHYKAICEIADGDVSAEVIATTYNEIIAEGEALAKLNDKIVVKVTYSEPGLKGDTATRTLKPATVETGATVNVPLFVNEGELIRINTKNGEYIERVKE